MELESMLEGFPVVITLPVSWGDMDAFQHVNNTTFFRYFEDARIAYFERTGLIDFSAAPTGIGPIVAHTACRFRAPLRYPDDLQVGARVTEVGQHSFKMEFRVISVALHAIAAQGSAAIVAYDFKKESKALLPETWRRALSHVENCDFPAKQDAPGDDEIGH